MRNFKYIMIAAMGLLFAMTSCSDGEEIVRTLEVEDSSITLNKEIQTKKIAVTADKGGKFTATWDGDNWGGVSTIDIINGFIEITTTKNTTNTLRKASVIVALEGGLRNRVINITQNGENEILSVIPDEINCDFMANEIEIEVSSNVEWDAKSEVEWLDVNMFPKSDKIIVAIQENTSIEARSTVITVTAGISSKEVMVIQGAGLSILLPYLNSQDATFDGIEAFEKARHSRIIKNYTRFAHLVCTRGNLMPTISYDLMGSIIDFVAIDVIEKYMPNFFSQGENRGKGYDFMLAQGFEYLFSAGLSDYFWIDQGEGATRHYLVRLYGERSFVTFEALTTKPSMPDLPTFDVFPHMPDDITFLSHKDVAKAWEKTTGGGVLSVEEDQLLIFNVITGDPLQYKRYYAYKAGGEELVEVTYIFNEEESTRLFLYLPGNLVTLNPKFTDLLTSEGFTKEGSHGGFDIFEHVERDILIKPYLATIGESSTQYSVISFQRRPGPGDLAPQFTPPAYLKAADVNVK